MYFHWNDWMVNTTVAAIICVHRNNRVLYYLFLSASMLFFKRKCNLQLFVTTGLYFFFYQIWQINVSSFNGLHFTDLEFWWHLLEFVASSAILTTHVHIRLILYRWHRHGKLTLGGGTWRLNGTNWLWGTEEDWFINPRLKPV